MIAPILARRDAAGFWLAVVLTGVGTGLAAAALTGLLELVQHTVWSGGGVDLLEAAAKATPWWHLGPALRSRGADRRRTVAPDTAVQRQQHRHHRGDLVSRWPAAGPQARLPAPCCRYCWWAWALAWSGGRAEAGGRGHRQRAIRPGETVRRCSAPVGRLRRGRRHGCGLRCAIGRRAVRIGGAARRARAALRPACAGHVADRDRRVLGLPAGRADLLIPAYPGSIVQRRLGAPGCAGHRRSSRCSMSAPSPGRITTAGRQMAA